MENLKASLKEKETSRLELSSVTGIIGTLVDGARGRVQTLDTEIKNRFQESENKDTAESDSSNRWSFVNFLR